MFIDGTKLESRAGRYTFVWRKNVEKHLAKVKEQVGKTAGLTTRAALRAHLEELAAGIDFGSRRFLTWGKANIRTELFLLALAFDLEKL